MHDWGRMMNFYEWQHRMLGTLMAWGATSVVLGAGGAGAQQTVVRQAARQAIVWGGIDLALAVAGRQDAQRKAQRFAAGQLQAADEHKAKQALRRILLINAGLDVGYVAAGIGLLQASQTRRRANWRGMGVGILLQGAFLLVYDALFVVLIDREAWHTAD